MPVSAEEITAGLYVPFLEAAGEKPSSRMVIRACFHNGTIAFVTMVVTAGAMVERLMQMPVAIWFEWSEAQQQSQ